MAKLRSFTVLIALGACACAVSFRGLAQQSPATSKAGKTGQGSKTMDITPYRLNDEAFWSSSKRGSDKIATQLVGEYKGLLVDAPRRIPIDQRSTFPIGLYHLGTIRDVSTIRFSKLGLMTAMDVTSNRLYVATGRAFEKDDDPVKGPPVAASKYPEGDMSSASALELRSVMKMPWEPANYLLTAILRDKVSNRAAVEMCQSPSCYVDPEVVKYRAAELAKINPGAVDPRPGETLPSYRKLDNSLAIPEQPGIALASTRLVDSRRDQPWLIQGAFRLTPIPQELVKPGWSDPYYSTRPADSRPTAVITIYLLMVGADDGSSYLWPLRVPSYPRASAPATGYFAFDLRQLRGAPQTPQTYFAYAFSGASMAGPVTAAVVSR